jgi:hypothetical protein
MPLPRELLEEMQQRRRVETRLANRDKVRDLVWTALQCWGWAVLGIVCILWSAHTTVLWLGRTAFWSGLAVGNGGIFFSLLAAYRRGERRGDW